MVSKVAYRTPYIQYICVFVSPWECVCVTVHTVVWCARASWQIRAFRPVTFLQSPRCIMGQRCEKCWSAWSTQLQMNGALGALTRRWMERSVLSAEVDQEVTVSSVYLCVCVSVSLLTLGTSYATPHTQTENYRQDDHIWNTRIRRSDEAWFLQTADPASLYKQRLITLINWPSS